MIVNGSTAPLWGLDPSGHAAAAAVCPEAARARRRAGLARRALLEERFTVQVLQFSADEEPLQQSASCWIGGHGTEP